jgi:hypothetical protein
MALNLACSFEYWNADNDIGLVIVTDHNGAIPSALGKTVALRVRPGELGRGFSSKLQLDRFAPADQTLFIDADCLCLGPLGVVFDRFQGRAVSVVGGTIERGEWFGDVESTCTQTGVNALPKFNGGIYYVEPGTKATAVYERARKLEKQYDQLGLVRLRGLPNDELLMAIAMAQEECWGIPEDGTIMGEFLSAPQVDCLNVLAGHCILRNPNPPDPRHVDWFPLEEVRPLVVHFLGSHVSGWRYKTEALRLRLVMDHGVPQELAVVIGTAYSLPFRAAEFLREWLRPAYRAFFGVRKLRPDVR